MSNLSAKSPRRFCGDNSELQADLTASAMNVYEGAALGFDSNGDLVSISGTSYKFAGIALESKDNSAGSAGAVRVRVLVQGMVWLNVTGLDDDNDIGKPVFANDNNTFTLTGGSGVEIGKVVEWSGSGTLCKVFVQSQLVRKDLSALTAVTDSTGGSTANTTLSAVGATNSGDVSATINANFAKIALLLNAVLTKANGLS